MGFEPRPILRRLMAPILLAVLVQTGALAASVTLSVADGAVLADTVTVTARVTGFEDSGVQHVRFLVDGEEKNRDSSIPYTFDWDTLEYSEGPHVLEAIATDMTGASARASVRVTIDNELGKGADHHGRIALEALGRKDADTARRHARRALRIDPKNVTAARALAALHRAAREYDRAIALLEQASIPEDDIEARRDLMALYVLRGDAGDTTESFLQGVTEAWEQAKRVDTARIERLKTAGAIERGDAAFAARRWRDAIIAYQSVGDAAEMPITVANRLLLAYVRAGRWRDCELLLRTLDRDNRADDVTRAVQGYYLLKIHKPAEARRVVQQAAENRVLPAIVVAAAADLILGDQARARDEIETAAGMAPDSAAVLYLQTFVTREPIDLRKQLALAVAADPVQPEILVRKAHEILASNRPAKYDEAERILLLARRMEEENADVLLTLAALYMVQERAEEAWPLLEALQSREKEAPDVLVGMALSLRMRDRRARDITDLLARAMKADEERWNDVFVPKPLEYLNRLMRYRITPLLTPQLLYPGG